MTFESRARGAVLDIHRAVEVMEMTTSTKEPRKIERFDQYRDQKQRNRRIGALVVAGVLVVAAIVVFVTNVPGRDKPVAPAGNGKTGVPVTTEPEGRIVYDVYDGGNDTAIFTIDVASRASQDLGIDTDPTPVWSPDGTRILITTTGGPPEEAAPVRPATVAADGSDYRVLDGLEDPSLNLGCTAYSPDGSLLACSGYNELVSGVYTVRASDGGGLRQLADVGGIPSDFSPDGQEIVFVADDTIGDVPTSDGGTLTVVGTDGSGLREITPPGGVQAYSEASWSPDGQWIAYIDVRGRLSLLHPDGTSRHLVSMPPEGQIDESVGGTSWSPDGVWIAFSARADGGENADLYVVAVAGAELRQITDYRQLTDSPDIMETTHDWTS
jgi:Tol biopolymer transport system component